MSEFAYGDNTVANCECPAVAAGYEPLGDDDVIIPQIAGKYDRKVKKLGYSESLLDGGRIPEEQAKEAWLEMINHVKDSVSFSDEQVEVAKEIAMILGWLDDD